MFSHAWHRLYPNGLMIQKEVPWSMLFANDIMFVYETRYEVNSNVD